MFNTPTTRQNPYPGPRAFRRGERLYGRDRETLELLDLLIAERIILLYSPSGAGKTSLIHAALIPLLEVEGFRVLPPMRVSLETAEAGTNANRYVLSLLLSLEEALPPQQQARLPALADMALSDYLDQHPPPQDRTGDLLILDQFEEILTVAPTDRQGKLQFFQQVGAALRNRNRWALFAMREEFVAGLDPYLRPIPTRFSARFRLELLGAQAALEAVQRPAHDAGVTFSAAAARRLVDDLRAVRVQRPDGTTATVPGNYVEPVQLQVVCRRLWQNLSAADNEIDIDDVETVGNVDEALRDYYADSIADVANTTGVRERAIRDWVDTRLITESGIRGQVLAGAEQSQGLDNRAIWQLVDAHLVRAEQRRGATWFELAHDRLIEPLRADNAAWRQAHLSALQRQAALWESEGRPAGLLLSGQALIEAEQWAASHQDELEAHETAFLAECVEARRIAQREQRQARRIRNLAVGATITAVIALIAFYLAIRFLGQVQEQAAELARQAELALSRQLAAQSTTRLDDQPDLALLLSLEANRVADTVEARGSLLVALERRPQLLMFLRRPAPATEASPGAPEIQTQLPPDQQAANVSMESIAFSPTGDLLAAGNQDGKVYLWDMASGQPDPRSPLASDAGSITAVAFSPQGDVLAVGRRTGTVTLWNLAADPPAPTDFAAHAEDRVNGLAFSPCDSPPEAPDGRCDGRTLASISKQDLILWDISDPDSPRPSPIFAGDPVRSLAFNPCGSPPQAPDERCDGQQLATGHGDGRIMLWDVATGQGQLLGQHKKQVSSLAFSPDGQLLAAGGKDSLIHLWDLAAGTAITLTGHTKEVQSVAFSPCDSPPQAPDGRCDGALLASGSRDETVRLWDVATGQPIGDPLAGHDGWVQSVAFSPATPSGLVASGHVLASGGRDGNVILWKAEATPRLARRTLTGHKDEVWAVAFSPDSRWLASGSKDATVVLWDLAASRAITLSQPSDAVRNLAFSPDSSQLAASLEDGSILLWPIGQQPGPPLRLEHSPGQPATDVAFSPVPPDGSGPAGQTLASSSFDKTIRLWDISALNAGLSAQPPTSVTLAGHEGQVWSVAFTPCDSPPEAPDGRCDGRRLVSSDDAGVILVWDLETRQPTDLRLDHGALIFDVAVSPDGQRVAAASLSEQALLWIPGAEKPVLLSRHTQPVTSVAFNPDVPAGSGGSVLATAGYDGMVILWDTATGRPIGQPLQGHQQPVNGLAFSPDGKLVASASDDGTVILWDVDQSSWQEQACRVANRNLSVEEWQQYLGDRPYRGTCNEVLRGR